jgi:hypothetical protein
VYIQFKPADHIADFYARTPLTFGEPAAEGGAPPLASARLEVEVDVRGGSDAGLRGLTVHADVYRWRLDGAGPASREPVLSLRGSPVPLWTAGDTAGAGAAAAAGAAARVTLAADVLPLSPELALWSAEEPNLYVLLLSLRDAGGVALEYEACQVSSISAHRSCTRPLSAAAQACAEQRTGSLNARCRSRLRAHIMRAHIILLLALPLPVFLRSWASATRSCAAPAASCCTTAGPSCCAASTATSTTSAAARRSPWRTCAATRPS